MAEMSISRRERRFASATGLGEVRYRMTIPEEVRAAVQVTHGMAEHIERYQDFFQFLAANGILVYGMDLMGHGKSIPKDGTPGYFGTENGWDALVSDMRRLYGIVKPDYPAVPFILFGHSMGSFLARTYAGRSGTDFDAFIFSGTAGPNPALGIGRLLAKWEQKRNGPTAPSKLLELLGFAGDNSKLMANLSRDAAVKKHYQEDPLCGFALSTSGAVDMLTGMIEIGSRQWAQSVPDKPIFLLSGAKDPVGDNGKGVTKVFERLKKTGHAVECKIYEDGRHEMLNEINREEAYRDILLFIEAVAAGGELR